MNTDLNLYNYEVQAVYQPDNIERGWNYFISHHSYEILVNKNTRQKYFNKISVCLKYIDHPFHETSDNATSLFEKAISKMLSRKMIGFIPNSTNQVWIPLSTISQNSTSITQTNYWYYAVKVGRQPGIYTTWKDACEQVINFPESIRKSFYKTKGFYKVI